MLVVIFFITFLTQSKVIQRAMLMTDEARKMFLKAWQTKK